MMGSISSFSFFFLPLIVAVAVTLQQNYVFAVTPPRKAAPAQAPSLPSLGANKRILDTCHNAVNVDLCTQTFEADPKSHHTDLTGLAIIAIKAAMDNASVVDDHIGVLLNQTKDPIIQQALTDCNTSYLDAVDQLADAIGALQEKVYNDVTTFIEAAIHASETCEEVFIEHPAAGQQDDEGLLSGQNGSFAQLCGNALSIVNLSIYLYTLQSSYELSPALEEKCQNSDDNIHTTWYFNTSAYHSEWC